MKILPPLCVVLLFLLQLRGAAQGPATLLDSLYSQSSSPQSGAAQGASVATNGTLAVVGCPGDDVGGDDAGVVKVYDVNSGLHLLTIRNPSPGPNRGEGDRFGA